MKSADEMKLTAYALGELSDAERAAVEARVQNDAAARAEVERIRDVAKLLSAELAAEPAPAVKPIQMTELRRQRRPRWAGRLAIAAAVSVVVGGVTYTVVSPALRTDRRMADGRPQVVQGDSSKQAAAARAQAQNEQWLASRVPQTLSAPESSAENDNKQIPYDDMLRTPANWPDASATREPAMAQASGPAPAAPSAQPAPALSLTPPSATPAEANAPFGVPAKPSASMATGTVNGGVAFRQGVVATDGTVATPGLGSNAIATVDRPDFTNAPTFNLQTSNAQQQGQQAGLFGGVGTGAGGGGTANGTAVANANVPAAATAADDGAGRGFTPNSIASRTGIENDRRLKRAEQIVGRKAIDAEARFDNRQLRAEQEHNTEAYDRVVDNAFLDVMPNPLSTFSIDVDTASYSNVRRFLTQGQKPPKDAVRIEEMVNYFPYDYDGPAKDAKEPFATHVEVADCPWRPEHRLVRVAIKGKEISADKRPASNLVFLLDVSGSMQPQNKLPMVKQSMRMLLDKLGGEDRVAIVVYAGKSGLALPSTACSEGAKESILNAIENLSAGGSTNGEEGIQLAYSTAKQNFIEGGTNRVILCTDGDFNVGVTNQGDLTRIIEEKAKAGVFLSVLGFGMGNLKDSTMEKLADKGNGNYAYIDTITEAKKVLVEQMSGTLVTIAKDVKIQIEFNPAVVGSYRLIGYENRLLAKEDFNDDKKDAGEIGAGHSVTALYEVVPAGKKGAEVATPKVVDELKYQKPAKAAEPRDGDASGEMLTLKLRYKQPDGDTSALIETPVKDEGGTFAKSSRDFKFASSVAAFGMILRESPHKGRATYPAVMEWAEDGVGEDKSGYRQEFIDLVKRAKKTEGQ